MKLLLSGLDTVECAYYLRPGTQCKLDFEALRVQREGIRQSKNPDAGVTTLGGTDFLLSPNGTRSGFPFLISNQACAIQFGEFNEPSFFVTYRSLALWTRGARQMQEWFLEWAASLGLVQARPESLSRCDFAFDTQLPVIDFDEDSFVTAAEKDRRNENCFAVRRELSGADQTVTRSEAFMGG